MRRSLRQGMRSLAWKGNGFASADSSGAKPPSTYPPLRHESQPHHPWGSTCPHCGAWVPRTSLRETGDWTRPGFERVARPTSPAWGLEKGGCLFRCNSSPTCPAFRRSLGRPECTKALDPESEDQRLVLALPEQLKESGKLLTSLGLFLILFFLRLPYIRSLWARKLSNPTKGSSKARRRLGRKTPQVCPSGWIKGCEQKPPRSLGPRCRRDGAQGLLSAGLRPNFPLAPRFALTGPGSGVCAAGPGDSASASEAEVPPGEADIAPSCSACGRGPPALSSEGRAAPGPLAEWARRGEGGACRPLATCGET